MNKAEIKQYHFDNIYGLESDPKIHEEYWVNTLPDDLYDLKDSYEYLMSKAGSWNSNEQGKLNAICKIFDTKLPNWRNVL